jgi:hypothetical protein
VTDLRPLRDSSLNPRTRELLRAGLFDKPEPRAIERVAAALGLVAGISTTTAGAAGAAGAAGGSTVIGAAGAGLTAGSPTIGVAVIAKWLAVGALSGTVVAGGSALVQRKFEAPASTTATPVVVNEPGGPGVKPSRAHAPELGEIREEPSPAGPLPAGGTLSEGVAAGEERRSPSTNPEIVRLAPSAAFPSDPKGVLARELAHIDRARAALAARDPTRVLAELSRYDEVRSTGTFEQEALVLRIDALVLLGERKRASELARGYLVRFPKDAHAARLGELAAEP